MWRKGEMAQSAILVKQAPLPSPQAAVDAGTAARSFAPVSSKSRRLALVATSLGRCCDSARDPSASPTQASPSVPVRFSERSTCWSTKTTWSSIHRSWPLRTLRYPQDPMPCFLCLSGLWPRGRRSQFVRWVGASASTDGLDVHKLVRGCAAKATGSTLHGHMT